MCGSLTPTAFFSKQKDSNNHNRYNREAQPAPSRGARWTDG